MQSRKFTHLHLNLDFCFGVQLSVRAGLTQLLFAVNPISSPPEIPAIPYSMLHFFTKNDSNFAPNLETPSFDVKHKKSKILSFKGT
jgi:hypothetical protein